MIYFDTSVLAAYYTPEERSDEAQAIVASARIPVVSDVGIAELNVVLERKARQGFLAPEAVLRVFEMFDEHLQDLFHRVFLDRKLIALTRSVASISTVSLRTLDALHLVVAVHLGLPLATFDRRLAEAARAVGIKVLPIVP